MHPFRAAVEAANHEAVAALLAPDVEFLSPVAFSPYRGRDLVSAILLGASRAFEDFRYVREITGDDGMGHALIFKARIGEREIHGCDFLQCDERGLIEEFCVMVRPLSAAMAVSAEMANQFELARRELGLSA